MDTVITSEPSTGSEAAVTSAPTPQTVVVGSGTELGQDQQSSSQSDPSVPQGNAEDTQTNQPRRREWSKQDEIRELRQQRREYRQEMQTLRQELEELRQWREQQAQQPKGGKSERNPAEFWQDPEARLEALLEEKLARLGDDVTGRFFQSREEHENAQAVQAEQQAGVEFIRSQPGYSPEDDEELISIIEDYHLDRLGPTQAAEIAWTKLQAMRGVSNKSSLKRQASGVQGQAPGAGLGKKIWSQAEYDAALEAYDKDRTKRNPELEAELVSAVKENRVR